MAFKKSRVRSGSFCTGAGSSRQYSQILQAGPEETRPNEIAVTGIARDACQLHLQSGFTFCGPDLGRKTALVLGPFLWNQLEKGIITIWLRP